MRTTMPGKYFGKLAFKEVIELIYGWIDRYQILHRGTQEVESK